jgi:DNA-directed RNA polymerase subunit RPC12/RpoP
MKPSKNDLKITLKTIYCPECGLKQPKIRMPKGWHEILWGGVTCSNCGCRMDKFGKERKNTER